MAMGGGSATKRSQLRAKDLLWWFIYRPPFLCVCVCVCVWELARLEAYLFIHFLIYWCLSDPKRFWLDPLGHQLFGWLAVELVGKMEKGGT